MANDQKQYSLKIITTPKTRVNDFVLIAVMSMLYDGDVNSKLVDKILEDVEKDFNPVLYFGPDLEKVKLGVSLLSEYHLETEIEEV